MSTTSRTIDRFKRLPQRTAEVWQGGIVRFPAWTENPADPQGPPLRVSGALWVSLRTGLINVALGKAGAQPTAQLALDTLLEFGLKQAKALEGRPARIEVRDPALRDALAAPLAELDTAIVVVEDMPAVRDALRAIEEEDEDGYPMPGLLDVEGMTVERVRAFAEAAALYHAARPWDRLDNEDLIAIEGAGVPRDQRFASVLGASSELRGISFFESRDDFDRLFEDADAGIAPAESLSVIFDHIEGLPFADVDAWLDHALPVAAPDAYPLMADFAVDGDTRRPSARTLSFTEGLLRALADTTDDELDAGTWQARVDTFDGPLDLRFSLPLLLEAEASRPRRHVPRQATALERAQALANEAMDAPGRLGIKLARKALAISEDCADAWLILADAVSTPEKALELYQRAMTAAEAAIGTDRFESMRGELGLHPEAKPYIRARIGVALALLDLDRGAEAVAHFRALLALDASDGEGVRYLLLGHLLREKADDDANQLLADYPDDSDPMWPYARLLLRYRAEGDADSTREAFAAAVAANPHVLKYLLDPTATPDRDARSDSNSREDAAYVADGLLDAYESTEGALDWLAANAPRRRRARAARSRNVH